MPYTINGVGTHYYGKRNRVRLPGECSSCKRLGVLESYETREFFVFIFIPLIPLRKFQILDSCPFCRRHRRLSLAEFHAHRDQLVERARTAAEQAPNDWEAQDAYAATLTSLFMMNEAIEAWNALIRKDGRRPTPHQGLGRALNALGRCDEAEASYLKCIELDPKNVGALVELSDMLVFRRQTDRGLEILKQYEVHNGDQTSYLAVLGDRAFDCKDWETAARVYSRLLQLQPAFAQNKRFMKSVKKAHKKAGIPLNAAVPM